jgi:hypothetical protein
VYLVLLGKADMFVPV